MLRVENGWQGLHEVNRVMFDPQRVTVEQMSGWLEKAGTLVLTLEQNGAGNQQQGIEDGRP